MLDPKMHEFGGPKEYFFGGITSNDKLTKLAIFAVLIVGLFTRFSDFFTVLLVYYLIHLLLSFLHYLWVFYVIVLPVSIYTYFHWEGFLIMLHESALIPFTIITTPFCILAYLHFSGK